jgi:hypothetical protein
VFFSLGCFRHIADRSSRAAYAVSSLVLFGLTACGGGAQAPPVAPRPDGGIAVSLVGRPALSTSASSPAPLGVMASSYGVVAPLSVTESGYTGTFTATVVHWNSAELASPCLVVVPRMTPNLVWISNPGPCVYDGSDVEAIAFSDPFGNTTTQYFQIVPGPHPPE